MVSVVAERDADLIVERSDQIKMALAAHSKYNVYLPTRFEDQFIPLYLSRIFPWALNYESGGPEYEGFNVPDATPDEELIHDEKRCAYIRFIRLL